MGPRRVGGPNLERWGPEGWGPRRGGGTQGWGPEGWGPKISRFFPSPATIFFLSSLSWASRGRVLQCARLEFSGCRVRTAAARSGEAAGVRTRQPENSKRAHFRAPALQKPHQNSTKRPPKREKKERKLWREREKKERNFGRSGVGGPGGGGPGEGGSGCPKGWGPEGWEPKPRKVGPPKGGSPNLERWGPEGWEPKPRKVGPRRVGPRKWCCTEGWG